MVSFSRFGAAEGANARLLTIKRHISNRTHTISADMIHQTTGCKNACHSEGEDCFMSIRKQHPEPEPIPQDNWRDWPRRRTHPAESRQASQAATFPDGEVRKATTPATRAEVRLATIPR
jgi:hypothetical protein